MNHPNGLAFSSDFKTLYVSNSRPDPHLHAYDVSDDGTLSNSRLVCEMSYGPAGELDGVPDGLKLDADGNIYSTGPGGLWVWDAAENYLGLVVLPELPANLGWGDPDNRTMFVTARTSVYSLRIRSPGIPVQH
jgi:gluconolactonase